MGMLKEFRDFAMKGNVVDLAVGVIIGAAFGKIVSVLVEKVLMPPLGLVIGGMDFSQLKFILQTAADGKPEVAISYGEFLNVLVNFILIAWALFMVIKGMNAVKKRARLSDPVAATPEEVLLLREIRDNLKK